MRSPIAPRAVGLALAALVLTPALPARGDPVPASAPEASASSEEGVRTESPAEPEPPGPSRELDPLFGDEEDRLAADAERRDPWEGVNRGIFSFNRELDRFVLDPLTRGYRFLVPGAGRRALHRAIRNLDAPVVFANQLLQLRFRAAGTTVFRFVVNSTAGVAGLFDAAAEGAGIERVDADFGQTLARYGTTSGPYVMLPLFGPSTVRDALGLTIDAAGDPLTYLIGPFQWWTLALGTGEGLVVREAHVEDLHALEEGSLDFYAALRSAYLQGREAAVREARDEALPVLAVRDAVRDE